MTYVARGECKRLKRHAGGRPCFPVLSISFASFATRGVERECRELQHMDPLKIDTCVRASRRSNNVQIFHAPTATSQLPNAYLFPRAPVSGSHLPATRRDYSNIRVYRCPPCLPQRSRTRTLLRGPSEQKKLAQIKSSQTKRKTLETNPTFLLVNVGWNEM